MASTHRKKTSYKDHELKQIYNWIQFQTNKKHHKQHIEFQFGKFVTLSFSKAPANTERARKLVEEWLHKMRGQPNPRYPLQWLYTIAHGQCNGRLHAHVLLFNRLAQVPQWPHGNIDSKDVYDLKDVYDMVKYIKRNKNKETNKRKNVTNIYVPSWFRLLFTSGKARASSRRSSSKQSPLLKQYDTTGSAASLAQAGAPGGAGAVAPALPQERKHKDCPTLEILVGITGSGKTHYAREKIKSNPSWVRVSREDLRAQITGADPRFSGYYDEDHKELEKHIAGMQMDQIRYWLQQGYNVIVDAPHLHVRYVYNLMNAFDHMANILVTTFEHDDIKFIINRLYDRDRQYDVQLVQSQWMNMEDFLKSAKMPLNQVIPRSNKTSSKIKHIIASSTNPECIIVNIDGCIADYRGVRDYHNDGECSKDRVVEPVRSLLQKTPPAPVKAPSLPFIPIRGQLFEWIRHRLKQLPMRRKRGLLLRRNSQKVPTSDSPPLSNSPPRVA